MVSPDHSFDPRFEHIIPMPKENHFVAANETGRLLISVIIVNWNTRELLRQCLRSVSETTGDFQLDITVVDNSSSDGSVQMVRELFPDVRRVELANNLGFSKSVNRGLALAAGQVVLICHPDIAFSERCLDTMVKFLMNEPEAGIVGPCLRYPDSSFNSVSTKAYSFRRICLDFLHFSLRPILRLVPPLANWVASQRDTFTWNHSQTTETEVVWNACMMFKRSVLDTIGPFDENFFVWYADVDWCLRARRAGWKAFYLLSADCIHYERQSEVTAQSEAILYKVDGSLVARQMAKDKQVLLKRHCSLSLRIVDGLLELCAFTLVKLRRVLPLA